MRIKLKIRTNVRREGKKNKVAVLSHGAATLFRAGHHSASITLIIPQSAVKCNVPFQGNCLLTRRVKNEGNIHRAISTSYRREAKQEKHHRFATTV